MGYVSGMESTDEETQLPQTYVVMRVAPDIHERALQWLVGKIRGKKSDGGGELVIMMQDKQSPEEEYIFHISATKIKLLEVAEDIELNKRDASGNLREFTVAQMDDFLPKGKDIDDLFTLSERQTMVKHELENIRALENDKFIPGYPLFKLYDNQAIIPVAQNNDLITKLYPLHDDEELKKLAGSWYMPRFMKQPVEEIKEYFGESIALYFTFLESYTMFLAVTMVLGLTGLIFDEILPFFCAFNVIWLTLFLELWKRKSNELAYKWGTIGMTSRDEPRPQFLGVMGIDAVTGKVWPQSPKYMTYIKMYACSIPVVILCMVLAFCYILLYYWAEAYLLETMGPDSYLPGIPNIVYTVSINLVISPYFRYLATYLTEWENHRTQSQFERHRVSKLVFFEFVNNFLLLFYCGFYLQNMKRLKEELQSMLMMSQLTDKFVQILMPLGSNFYNRGFRMLRQKTSSGNGKEPERPEGSGEKAAERSFPLLNIPQLAVDDPRIIQAQTEGDMDEYEDTFDDYLQLYIQFGYIFLFSAVYPIAAFCGFISNIFELRCDAYKLCHVYRRPSTKKVKDIGAWQVVFEGLGYLSILTNCALLYLSPDIRAWFPNESEVELLLLFVCVAQFLVGVRYILHISISEKPEWVKVAIARKNYEYRQAFKFERSQRNRKLLYRFRTVQVSPSST